jgi:hypothetical protein
MFMCPTCLKFLNNWQIFMKLGMNFLYGGR